MDKKNECQICGKPINLEEFDETREIPQLMARKQVCFQCAFGLIDWLTIKNLKREENCRNYSRLFSLGN